MIETRDTKNRPQHGRAVYQETKAKLYQWGNSKTFLLVYEPPFLDCCSSHGSSKKLLFARDRDRLRKPHRSKHREQLVTESPTQQVRLQHNYRLHLRLSAHQGAHQVHISAHKEEGAERL